MKTKLNKRATGGYKGLLNSQEDRLIDDITTDLYLVAYSDRLSVFKDRQPNSKGSMSDDERELIIDSMRQMMEDMEEDE